MIHIDFIRIPHPRRLIKTRRFLHQNTNFLKIHRSNPCQVTIPPWWASADGRSLCPETAAPESRSHLVCIPPTICRWRQCTRNSSGAAREHGTSEWRRTQSWSPSRRWFLPAQNPQFWGHNSHSGTGCPAWGRDAGRWQSARISGLAVADTENTAREETHHRYARLWWHLRTNRMMAPCRWKKDGTSNRNKKNDSKIIMTKDWKMFFGNMSS